MLSPVGLFRRPGEFTVWELEIRKAINKADFIVICISRRSINKRGFVQREIKLAIETYQAMPAGEAFLMPARLEDCSVPEELSAYQYCDLFGTDGLRCLVDAILTHWAKRIGERDGSGANLKGSASGGNGLNDRTDVGAGTLQGSAFRPRNYCPVRAVVLDIQAQ